MSPKPLGLCNSGMKESNSDEVGSAGNTCCYRVWPSGHNSHCHGAAVTVIRDPLSQAC